MEACKKSQACYNISQWALSLILRSLWESGSKGFWHDDLKILYTTMVTLKAFKTLEIEVFLHIYGSTLFKHLQQFRNCSTYRVRYRLKWQIFRLQYVDNQIFSSFWYLLSKVSLWMSHPKTLPVQYNLTSFWHHMKVSNQL